MIYHLLTPEDWRACGDRTSYRPASLAKEGFIHCSTRDQLLDTAMRYFDHRPELLVLVIEPGRVVPNILYEGSAERGQAFPHIYGALNRDAILAVYPLTRAEHGGFQLPDAIGVRSPGNDEP